MISYISKRVALASCAAASLLLAGCAAPQPYDYTALRQSKPQSILVMPPLNQTPEVTAQAGVLSRATLPLAEVRDAVLNGLVQDLGRIQQGDQLPALGEGAACTYCAVRGLCRRDFWR